MRNIFFRADGSSSIGLGHIYRACALAQILQKDFTCHFLIGSRSGDVLSIVSDYFSTSKYLSTSSDQEAYEVASLIGADDIVVLDGYHFDTSYQAVIKETGARLVCVDDIFACYYVADVVINHAGGVSASSYRLAPETRLFLGPQYAIIRKTFVDMAAAQRDPIPGRIMVSLGGADPQNDTTPILHQLISRTEEPQRDIHVVIGAHFQFLPELQGLAAQHAGIRLHNSIGAESMVELMASSSLCIASPSTVTFEFLTASKGRLVVKAIADNQNAFFRYLTEAGFATSYSHFLKETTWIRFAASTDAIKAVFDGGSHARILKIFKSI